MDTAVSLQLIVLAEGTFIDKELNTFTSSKFTTLVLTFNTLLTSTNEGLLAGFSKTLRERFREISSGSKGALQNQQNSQRIYGQTHSTL
jgi:hypothetical protein